MDDLVEEIAIERGFIDQTLDLLSETLARDERTQIELVAIGSFLHDIYNGIENLLKRILVAKGFQIPDSRSSHRELLTAAGDRLNFESDLLEKLDKFRAFRHFFRHRYGLFLDEGELLPLAHEIPAIWEDVKEELDQFVRNTAEDVTSG